MTYRDLLECPDGLGSGEINTEDDGPREHSRDGNY